MTHHIRWIPGWLFFSLFLTGCPGTGQMHNFDLHALPSAPARGETAQDDSMLIAVEPFQDQRPQTKRIGRRTHITGGITQFNAWNGDISNGMADLAVEYLTRRNLHASRAQGKPDAPPPNVDVILAGEVLAIDANAKSSFFGTDLDVAMKVSFEATNLPDGSSIRMVLGANGTDHVMFFSPDDLERLTTLVVNDLFRQLFQDLTVKGKTLHLKSEAR